VSSRPRGYRHTGYATRRIFRARPWRPLCRVLSPRLSARALRRERFPDSRLEGSRLATASPITMAARCSSWARRRRTLVLTRPARFRCFSVAGDDPLPILTAFVLATPQFASPIPGLELSTRGSSMSTRGLRARSSWPVSTRRGRSRTHQRPGRGAISIGPSPMRQRRRLILTPSCMPRRNRGDRYGLQTHVRAAPCQRSRSLSWSSWSRRRGPPLVLCGPSF